MSMIEERIAWIIDPEAFSDETRRWERVNPGGGIWGERRQSARRKARLVIFTLTEEGEVKA